MKLFKVCIFIISTGVVLGLPRQEGEAANRLDEPLTDPELRRTLLRVFAESLKAAAETGATVALGRSASNVPVEEIPDLTPPRDSNANGFNVDQTGGELLLLSGDTPRGRAASSGISFTTTEASASNNENEQQFSADLGAGTELLQGDSTNHHGTNNQQHTENVEARTESSPAQPPAEPLFPEPSPAPPPPASNVAITFDDSAIASKLSPADNEDVQRFVSAVKTADESLGEGVELFQAPLIAAFALQQDGDTGLTRSLLAFPVKHEHEKLLKQERQILSVAGQVIGTQRIGITPRFKQQQQQNLGHTVFDVQRSIQPQFRQQEPLQQLQFRQQEPLQLLNEVEPQTLLQRLERRQLELQQQLLNLQRERSAILLQRSTRGSPETETLQTASSSSPFSIPIFLQPPFF